MHANRDGPSRVVERVVMKECPAFTTALRESESGRFAVDTVTRMSPESVLTATVLDRRRDKQFAVHEPTLILKSTGEREMSQGTGSGPITH